VSTEQTVLLPEAGPISPTRAWLAVAAFSVRQTMRKRAILAFAVMAVPALLGVIVRVAGARLSPDHMSAFYWGTTVFVMPTAVVPLIAMLFCTTLILNEAAEGTLVYLFTRRLSRRGVLLAKFAGTLFTLVGLACVAQLLLFLVAATGARPMRVTSGAPELWGALAVMALGAVVLSAIFTMLGMLFARPLRIGVGYLILCEWVFASIPLNVQQFSVNYYLRCILVRIAGTPKTWKGLRDVLGEDAATVSTSLLTLAVVALAALLVSAFFVGCKEFTKAREEQR